MTFFNVQNVAWASCTCLSLNIICKVDFDIVFDDTRVFAFFYHGLKLRSTSRESTSLRIDFKRGSGTSVHRGVEGRRQGHQGIDC